MSNRAKNKGVAWRITDWTLRRIVFGAASWALADRTLHLANGQETRWLKPQIDRCIAEIESAAAGMHALSSMSGLSFGNRLMVQLSLYTVASYRQFRELGLADESAREVTGDLGWRVYRRMLGLYSLPIRLLTRDPARRLGWTIRMLLRFPFNPGEPNGYAVKTWQENGNIHTHFTRCPPQSAARAVSERHDDPAILDAFYHSWCLYDWPGADVIAGDGRRGHYARPKTLSRGDPVCDMCWIGQVKSNSGKGFEQNRGA